MRRPPTRPPDRPREPHGAPDRDDTSRVADEGRASRLRIGALHAMTTCSPASPSRAAVAALPSSVRRRIFLYLGILIVLVAFGAPSGGLIDIPISFFLKKQAALGGARSRQLSAFVRCSPLHGLVFRFRPRHLESVRNARPGFHAVIRNTDRRPLCLFCLHPRYICHAPCCGRAVDDLVSLCCKRAERPDVDARPAARDVRSGQRGVEHLLDRSPPSPHCLSAAR